MNAARAAILLTAVVLSGCAMRTTHPADGAKRSGFTPAQERPGLGTAWGEQRDSWVEPVPFARSSGERPAGQDRIYYNDREGVNAMLDFLGGDSKPCGGMQQSTSGLLRFGVRTGNGRWVECHELRGRRFAVAESGERYEVVLRNDARRAVEILLSVDGLDVIDGKPASFKKRGYVLAPFETLAVDGFRTSNATVAAFRFGSMFDSYGHRRHRDTTNAGVIGVAVFEEQRRKAPAAPGNPGDHAWRSTGTRPPASRDGFAPPPEA
jgi:hypothetical protein